MVFNFLKRFKYLVFIFSLLSFNTNLFSMERIKKPRRHSFSRSNSLMNLCDYHDLSSSETPTGEGKDKEYREMTPLRTMSSTRIPLDCFESDDGAVSDDDVVSNYDIYVKKYGTMHIVTTIYQGEKLGASWYKSNSKKDNKEFKKEMSFLMGIGKHENIISLKGFINSEKHKVLFTEPADISLFDALSFSNQWQEYDKDNFLIKKFKKVFGHKDKIKFLQKIKISKDITSGVNYMHQNGYVHRDLKAKNIVLFSNKDDVVAKLIDFTSYDQIPDDKKFVFDKEHKCHGTLFYIAPENFIDLKNLNAKIFEGEEIGADEGIKVMFSNDIYSLGLLLWEIFYGLNVQLTWQDFIDDPDNLNSSFEEAYSDINFNDRYFNHLLKQNWRPDLDLESENKVVLLINSLIADCWQFDYNKRPIAKEVFDRLIGIEEAYLENSKD